MCKFAQWWVLQRTDHPDLGKGKSCWSPEKIGLGSGERVFRSPKWTCRRWHDAFCPNNLNCGAVMAPATPDSSNAGIKRSYKSRHLSHNSIKAPTLVPLVSPHSHRTRSPGPQGEGSPRPGVEGYSQRRLFRTPQVDVHRPPIAVSRPIIAGLDEVPFADGP